MELTHHLGLKVQPNPTLQSVLFKCRGYAILVFLFLILANYHVLSAVLSTTAIFFPQFAESTKRLCSVLFWDLTIYLALFNEVDIQVTGDSMKPESALIISNHQSLADHVIVAWLARSLRKHHLIKKFNLVPQVNFFTWFNLWRLPSIKTLYNIVKSDENWELLALHCERLFNRVIKTSTSAEWVVVFPEVNVWTALAAHLQQIQAQQYFLPYLDQVLYPRYSSLFNTVTQLNTTKQTKFVRAYNISITYSSPPTLLSFFSSPEKLSVLVHVKEEQIAKIPKKKPKFDKWLEMEWIEKDYLLEKDLNFDKVDTADFIFKSNTDEPLSPLLGW